MSECPCGSAAQYEECCGRYIQKGLNPPTAEALMRSRYSAYVKGVPEYIAKTALEPAPIVRQKGFGRVQGPLCCRCYGGPITRTLRLRQKRRGMALRREGVHSSSVIFRRLTLSPDLRKRGRSRVGLSASSNIRPEIRSMTLPVAALYPMRALEALRAKYRATPFYVFRLC